MQPSIEKLRITKLATRKKMEPRNTNEKKFWTHETPTRIKFEPKKYPIEKLLDPRNIHEKKFPN